MVMNNPWLREKDNWWVRGPQVQGVHDLYVKDLFLPEVKQWDVGKVNFLFDRVEDEAILRVSLVEEVVEDMLVWQEERNGEYSVKSRYKLWRGVQSNIRHYGSEEDEDEWHVFFGCVSTSQSWRAACLSSIIYPRIQTFYDAKSLIFDVCSREDRRDAGKFDVLLESFWRSRNDVLWQDDREDAIRIGLQAYHNWYDWFLARNEHNVCATSNNSVDWIPPMIDQVKCNVDAGFNNVGGTTNRG
ncbi:uncharacterized protein LOC131627973 [Vicia villosa]|uniref:uncharacterized protein LOC131627973 n=1 Tax=Vicia villosa TaxID=3911 RepID=UPI00273AE218|nr:uncharacterized protein LOC131627973 [Vicia villosa]